MKRIGILFVLMLCCIPIVNADVCYSCRGTNVTINNTYVGIMNQTPNMTASNLDTSWNISYWLRDATRSVTGTGIYRDVNNDFLLVTGGNAAAPYGAQLQLYGGDNVAMSGGFSMVVGNAVGNMVIPVISALGRTDTPYLDLNSHQIKNLQDPTNPQDAMTLEYFTTHPSSGGSVNYTGLLFQNGTRFMTGNLSMDSYYINNLTTGTNPSDAVNRSFVDTKVYPMINESYAYKPGVSGGQTINGGTGDNQNLVLNATANGFGRILMNYNNSWTNYGVSIYPEGEIGINTSTSTPTDIFTIISDNPTLRIGSTGDSQTPRLFLSYLTTNFGLAFMYNTAQAQSYIQSYYQPDSETSSYGKLNFQGYDRLGSMKTIMAIYPGGGNVTIGAVPSFPTAQFQTTGSVRFQSLTPGAVYAGGDGTLTTINSSSSTPQGYTLSLQALSSTLALTTTGNYFANSPKVMGTAPNQDRIIIPKTGTIKGAYLYSYAGTVGTATTISMYIKNSTMNANLIATNSTVSAERFWNNASMSIPVVAGEPIQIRVNTTAVIAPVTAISGNIYIE